MIKENITMNEKITGNKKSLMLITKKWIIRKSWRQILSIEEKNQ